MVRKAKKSRTKAKSRRRVVKQAKARTAKSVKTTRRKARTPKSMRAAEKSPRKQQEPIPAAPAGRIGMKRPSNEPKAPGPKEPREIAQAEPDARFDDSREPESSAREIAGSGRSGDTSGYKNTDEKF